MVIPNSVPIISAGLSVGVFDQRRGEFDAVLQ